MMSPSLVAWPVSADLNPHQRQPSPNDSMLAWLISTACLEREEDWKPTRIWGDAGGSATYRLAQILTSSACQLDSFIQG